MAGDQFAVVEGMKVVPPVPAVLLCDPKGIVDAFDQLDFAAVGLCSLNIVQRGVLRHDNPGPHSQGAACIGDALGEVPAAHGHNAGFVDLIEMDEHLVESASRFEGTCFLKQLQFDVHVGPQAFTQAAVLLNRGAMNVGGNPITSSNNFV